MAFDDSITPVQPQAAFTSGGAAVAGQLQQILARKRAAAQQELLNKLAQQKADTDQMEGEARAKYYEGEAKRYEDEANQRFTSQFGMGQVLDQDTQDEFTKRHLTSAMKQTLGDDIDPYSVNEDGSIAEGPVPTYETTYAGSPKEQLEARQNEELSKLLDDPEFMNAEPLKQRLILSRHGINNVNVDQLRKTQNSGHLFITDASGKITAAINPLTGKPFELSEDRFQSLPAPPQGRESKIEWDYVYQTNERGERVAVGIQRVINGVPEEKLQPLPAGATGRGISIGNAIPAPPRPPGGGGEGGGIDPNKGVFNAAAVTGYQRSKALASSAFGAANKRSAAAQATQLGDGMIASASNLTPNARLALQAVMNDYKNELMGNPAASQYGKIPSDALAQAMARQGKISPEEVGMVSAAIYTIRGR